MDDGDLNDAESSFHLGGVERGVVRVWRDRAEVRVGEFTGVVKPYFTREVLAEFRDELNVVHETLRGTATFADFEGQIRLVVEATKHGRVEVRGEARGENEGWEPTRLEFVLQIDQTFLVESLRELDDWLARERAPWPEDAAGGG